MNRNITPSISQLPFSCLITSLSYLDQDTLLIAGLVCTSFQECSKHPSLWTTIVIQRSQTKGLSTLMNFIQRTSSNLPLQKLSLVDTSSDYWDLPNVCYCTPKKYCSICCSSKGIVPQVAGTENYCCQDCNKLLKLEDKFNQIKEFRLIRASWFHLPSLQLVLKSSKYLKTIEISQNININIFINYLSSCCPALENLSFEYKDAAQLFEKQMNLKQIMNPSMADILCQKCPLLRRIRFSNYCITEDSINKLVSNLHDVEFADFSSNENVLGSFLFRVPNQWPGLRELSLRDCTELEDFHIISFLHKLANNDWECRHLEVLDISCQWSYVNQSLLDAFTTQKLIHFRPGLLVREDQCQLEGYGVDPSEGLDDISFRTWIYCTSRMTWKICMSKRPPTRLREEVATTTTFASSICWRNEI